MPSHGSQCYLVLIKPQAGRSLREPASKQGVIWCLFELWNQAPREYFSSYEVRIFPDEVCKY